MGLECYCCQLTSLNRGVKKMHTRVSPRITKSIMPPPLPYSRQHYPLPGKGTGFGNATKAHRWTLHCVRIPEGLKFSWMLITLKLYNMSSSSIKSIFLYEAVLSDRCKPPSSQILSGILYLPPASTTAATFCTDNQLYAGCENCGFFLEQYGFVSQ